MTTSAPVAPVPAVGTGAPPFTLPSTAGRDVSLADFHGRQHVLLAFFPLAFTSTCTAEMCAFSDDFDAFASQDVAVLPVSVDSVPTLREFKRQNDMKVELLSDFRRTASRAYGVLSEERFHSTRAYFLIDRSGIVRWAHLMANPGKHLPNEEILAEIRKL
jgi:mycoredoxin-dependent peroxiredoxin